MSSGVKIIPVALGVQSFSKIAHNSKLVELCNGVWVGVHSGAVHILLHNFWQNRDTKAEGHTLEGHNLLQFWDRHGRLESCDDHKWGSSSTADCSSELLKATHVLIVVNVIQPSSAAAE